jgi:hypothetical protein
MTASKPVKVESDQFSKQELPMTVIHTYHTMFNKIHHTVPTGHAYRERNLAWFMTGVYHSRSVHTSRVANKIPGRAKRASRTRRLSRFLDNGQVRVRQWYRPTAARLLQDAARAGVIRLIIDATKIAQDHQLLMVALAYRRRALPIAWTWLRGAKGHSSSWKQVALLSYVHNLAPSGATVVLTGDSEFTPLQTWLDSWQWLYVLRQKGSHLYRPQPPAAWQRVDSLVTRPGQSCWLAEGELTQQRRVTCNFLAYWRRGEKEPWLLATNLTSARQTIQQYKGRAWIEAMFADFKSNGADLEQSHLDHFLRLSRLTLVVALLYVWLVALGATTIKRGDRHLIDRVDRRDLSIYRIGNDMFERCLINHWPTSIRDVPYFT